MRITNMAITPLSLLLSISIALPSAAATNTTDAESPRGDFSSAIQTPPSDDSTGHGSSDFTRPPTATELQNMSQSQYIALLAHLVESGQATAEPGDGLEPTTYQLLDRDGNATGFSLIGSDTIQPALHVEFKIFRSLKIVYNQTDQKALRAGGATGVLTLAGRAAKAIPNPWAKAITVAAVAGPVAAAAVYINANSVCPENKNLVHTVSGLLQNMRCV